MPSTAPPPSLARRSAWARDAGRLASRIAKRAATLLAILLAVFALSRALVRALPGDPVETLLSETGSSIAPEALRAELGLDRPFLQAAASDLGRALRGDLGRSILSKEPIAPLLGRSLLRSAALTLAGLALGLLASLVLGVSAAAAPATRRSRWADRLCTLHGALAAAMPAPWIGPILMYALAVRLPLFPIGNHLALPAFTLAIGFSGFWARLIRERVRETLRFGAATGARARGLPEWKVLLKYGLAPASGSLLGYLGTQLGALLAGAFVIEVIFDWPGMGALLVDSVLRRDYPVVEAAVFAGAALALLGNALGDGMQAAVRREQEGAAG